MDDDIKIKCEKSFYQELYHFEESSQGLFFDSTTGRVLLKKTLDTYDIGVYRWLRENHCRNIPFIQSFWEENGRLVVLEEYIQGESLDTLISRGALDRQQRIRVIMDVCDALIFLHSAPIPIIHRDIKAANIMVSTDGVGKLIDYDAAKTFHAGKKEDTTLIGTVGAAAPEQYGFAQSDARTDIYSLGILIKELFPGDKGFEGIVQKATQMEPRLRYQSVREMKRAIEGISAGGGRGRGKTWVILFCAALFAALVMVVFAAGFGVYRGLRHAGTERSTEVSEVLTGEERSARESEDLTGEEKSVRRSEEEPESDISSEEDKATEKPAALPEEIPAGSDTVKETNSESGLSISESSWRISRGSDNSFITYCAVLFNSTEESSARLPALNVTARSGEGIVLGTDRMVGASIMPGDKGVIEGLLSIAGYAPEEIEVSFDLEKPDMVSAESDPHPKNSDFTIRGMTENTTGMFPTITGEVISHYERRLDEAKMTAVLRNKGKIVSSETTFISDIETGSPKAFEINLGSDTPIHDETEIYVCEW